MILRVSGKKGCTRTVETHVRVDCRGWDSPNLKILCSCELAVCVKGGLRGGAAMGSLFARLFNRFLIMLDLKNFEVALFLLICQFGIVENKNNRNRVVSDPICRLIRNISFL